MGWREAGRISTFEPLELRTLLSVNAVTIAAWHNAADPGDVNDDGQVTPLDALAVINDLNANGSHADGATGPAVSFAAASSTATPLASPVLTHDLLDVNADGMVSPLDALAIINQLDAPAPQVQYRLQVSNVAGQAISDIPVGEEFEVQVFVTDLRANDGDNGVFSAYLNTSYDSTLATPTVDPITHAAPYTETPAGNFSTPGIVSDAGGISTSLAPIGTAEFPVETMYFQATSAGSLTFTPNLPDPNSDAQHRTVEYGGASFVDPSLITANPVTLTIDPTTAPPPPSISIDNVSQIDGNSGTSNFVFDVTLSAPSPAAVAVNYATADGTATSGVGQYVPTSGTLMFQPGATTGQITVQVPGSNAVAPTETFTVNLSDPRNATISNGTGTGTILGVSVSNTTVTEVFSGSPTQAVFNITLSQAMSQPTSFNFATANGTATSPTNYLAKSGVVTFPVGSTSQQVTVTVEPDVTPQPSSDFFLNLTDPTSGASVGQGVATIAPPALSVDDVTETIGTSGITNFVFAVGLSGTVPDQVTVGYATADQSAIAGQDYSPRSGVLTFAAGQTGPLFITVPVFGSTVFSPDKTFVVNLSSPTGGVEISRAQGIGTIQNPNMNGLTVGDITVLQPASGTNNAVFTVILPTASTQPVTVQYSTADGSAVAGTDYVATPGTLTLTFAPGVTSQQVTVVVNGTTVTHPTEDFFLNLSNAVGASIARAQATATVENAGTTETNQAKISLEIVDVNGVPITGSLKPGENFEVEAFAQDLRTVTPEGVFAAYLNVAYQSNEATVAGPISFSPNFPTFTSGNVSLPGLFTEIGATTSNAPGVTGSELLFTVPMQATAVPGQLQFTASPAQLFPQHDVLLYGGTGTDTAAVPVNEIDYVNSNTVIVAPNAFSIASPAAVTNGPAGTSVVFAVSRAFPDDSTQPVTVNFATADGSSVGGVAAVAGVDYTAQSGTLTFLPGQSTPDFITVPVIGTTEAEPTKTFSVVLQPPVNNGSIITSTAIGTILNNNPSPTATVGDASAFEGQNITFTVNLSQASGFPITINYATVNGTATAGVNYVANSGMLTFAPGVTSQSITVLTSSTLTQNSSLTFSLQLSNPTHVTLLETSVTGTINVPAVISGFVYVDANNNGQRDSTETGIQNVTITINSTATNFNGTPVFSASTTTAGNGSYSFVGLPAGTYNIIETPPAFFTPGTPTSGEYTNITLAASQSLGNFNFGELALQAPFVSIADVTQTVGTSGTTNFVFAVTLSGATANQVTVGFATADQTAIAGQDYTAQSGNLTFAPGVTEQDITVPVFGTTSFAPDKTFLVNLSSPSGGVGVARATAIGTIQNPNVNGFSVGDITVLQPASSNINAVFTVSLPIPSTQQVTVQYATADGSATAPTDYVSASGTLTFAPGVTSQQVTVTVNANPTTHPNETFTLNLSNAVGVAIARGQATATIVNAGTAPPEAEIKLEIVDSSGNQITTPLTAGETFFVEAFTQDLRTNVPAAQQGVFAAYLNVTYPPSLAKPIGNVSFGSMFPVAQSGDLSVGGDFKEIGATEGSISPPGPAEQMLFKVPMVAMGAGVLEFSANAAALFPQHDVLLYGGTGSSTAAVPVTQVKYVSTNMLDVGANSFSIDDQTQFDTASGLNFVFTVTRVLPDNTTATVDFSTANGTGVAGTDYTAVNGTLTFAPGTLSQTITVPVLGTTEDQPSKTFFVNLTNPVNAAIGISPGTGTIEYNNPAPTFTIADASANEGQPVQFQVTLSQVSGFPITINYATANGTATAGVNYSSANGVLTFPAGTRTETISVPTIATLTQVGNLTFTIQLTNPTNATASKSTATGTIDFVSPTHISGFVYVDTNGDGQMDNGETGIQGVTVTVSSTATGVGGAPLFTKSTVTAANGSYDFIGLTPGTYNVVETQPGFFVNGTPSTNQYLNVSLAAAQTVNLNFGELGLRAQFVAAFTNRRAFLASTETTGTTGVPAGTQNVDLSKGDVWISFDNGWQNAREFQELFNTAQGTATMTLYDNNFNVLATSTANATGSVLFGNATLGTPYFLKISGTSTLASLKIIESLTTSSPTVTKSGSTVTPMVFNVVLSAPEATAVTVTYATADGTAVAGQDYVAEAGALTFAPGVTSLPVTVPVLASTLFGPSEKFSLNLSNPTNAFVNIQGTGTILNNNSPPSMSIADRSVIDPTAGTINAVFTVSLSAPSGSPATVAYTTAAGTAPSGDFIAQSGTPTFAPGTVTQNITVPVRADSSLTANETFLVKLTGPVGAILVRSQATGTIEPSTVSANFAVASATPAVATPAVSNAVPAASAPASTTSNTTPNGALANSSLSGNTASPTSKNQATDEVLAADESWAIGPMVL